jgi:hypothetical protein
MRRDGHGGATASDSHELLLAKRWGGGRNIGIFLCFHTFDYSTMVYME